jgi:hypothetical protein
MKAFISFFVLLRPTGLAFSAEEIAFAADMRGYLALHWIVGWSCVAVYRESCGFTCFGVTDFNGFFVRGSEA